MGIRVEFGRRDLCSLFWYWTPKCRALCQPRTTLCILPFGPLFLEAFLELQGDGKLSSPFISWFPSQTWSCCEPSGRQLAIKLSLPVIYLTLLTWDSIGNFTTSFWVAHPVSPADCSQFLHILHITATHSRRTCTFSPGYPKNTFQKYSHEHLLAHIGTLVTGGWIDPTLQKSCPSRGFMIWWTRSICCQHWSSFDDWWSLMIRPPWQWFRSYEKSFCQNLLAKRQVRFIRFSIV